MKKPRLEEVEQLSPGCGARDWIPPPPPPPWCFGSLNHCRLGSDCFLPILEEEQDGRRRTTSVLPWGATEQCFLAGASREKSGRRRKRSLRTLSVCFSGDCWPRQPGFLSRRIDGAATMLWDEPTVRDTGAHRTSEVSTAVILATAKRGEKWKDVLGNWFDWKGWGGVRVASRVLSLMSKNREAWTEMGTGWRSWFVTKMWDVFQYDQDPITLQKEIHLVFTTVF